MKGYCNS